MPQAAQVQAAVIPEPIPDNFDLSLDSEPEDLPDYETPSPEDQARSPPSEEQQEAFFNWLQHTVAATSPRKMSPSVSH